MSIYRIFISSIYFMSKIIITVLVINYVLFIFRIHVTSKQFSIPVCVTSILIYDNISFVIYDLYFK